MVDPNRKINRLTAEDIAFLDECEELFGNRFTENDDEFSAHCEKTFPDPPVLMSFSLGGGGGGGSGGQGQNNSYRGRYNDNRYSYRGGRGGGGQRGYHRRDHAMPYNRRRGFGGGSGVGATDGGDDGRYRQNYRNHRNYRERNDEHAMNVRRDYGKFVAASKSENSPVDNG